MNPTYKTLIEYSDGLFTDITSAVQAISISRGIIDPTENALSGRAIIKVANDDGKFNDSYTENLLGYSEGLGNWVIANSATVGVNMVVAPDGMTTADIVSDPSSADYPYVFAQAKSGSCLPGSANTLSMFIGKDSTPASSRFPLLRMSFFTGSGTGGLGYCELSLDTQTGSHYAGTNDSRVNLISYGVLDCGSYWRAYITSDNSDSTVDRVGALLFPAVGVNSLGSTGFSSSVVGSCAAWGAQVNKGGLKNYYPSSGTYLITAPYIPIGRRVKVQAENKNLLLNSDTLDAAGWTNTASLSSSSIDLPRGVLKAYDLQTTGYVSQTIITYTRAKLTASMVWNTNSCTTNQVQFLIENNAETEVVAYTFSTVTETASLSTATSGQGLGATITGLGNGWYRVSMSGMLNSTSSVRLRTGSPGGSLAGQAVGEFQLEHGELSRYTTTTSANPTYDLFTGYIQSIDQDTQWGNRIADINCYDLSQKLSRAKIDSPVYTNYPVSSLAVEICSLAGVGSLTSIDAITDTVPYFYANNETALGALKKLIDFGHYYAYTSADGDFHIKDRNSYATATPVGSYNAFMSLKTTFVEDKIFNDVAVTGQARTLATNPATLGWLSTAVTVPAGGQTQFWIQYIDPDVPTEAAPATNMITPVASSDWLINGATDGSGADLIATATSSVTFFGEAALCTVYNGSGAAGYLTKFQVRGYSIQKKPAVRQTSVDSASQLQYGNKQFRLDSDLIYNPDYAAGYAGFVIDKYAGAYPAIRGGLERNLFPDILNIEVGDVLSITNSFLNVGSNYVVRTLVHTIETNPSIKHDLSVNMEVLRTGPFLVLDNATLGLLDSNRELGF